MRHWQSSSRCSSFSVLTYIYTVDIDNNLNAANCSSVVVDVLASLERRQPRRLSCCSHPTLNLSWRHFDYQRHSVIITWCHAEIAEAAAILCLFPACLNNCDWRRTKKNC